MSELHGEREYLQYQIELEGRGTFDTTHENTAVYLHSEPLTQFDHLYVILKGLTLQQRAEQALAEQELCGANNYGAYIFREKLDKIARGLFDTIQTSLRESGYYWVQKPWVCEDDQEAYIQMHMQSLDDL